MADADDNLADWWVKWRKADFTWEGLANADHNKRLQGWVVADGVLREADNGRIYGQPILESPQPIQGRPATLQDYWRANPATGRLRSDAELGDELVHAKGQPTYHRAHLPLAYADGTATGKAKWANDALDVLVAARLTAASETVWQWDAYVGQKIVGPDRDAQLQGGIWLKAASQLCGADHPLSLRHNLALIFGDADFGNAKFSGDARFLNAAFSGDAMFAGAAFSGNASFQYAAMSGGSIFEGAAFSGDAWFYGAAFSAAAGFSGAAFSGRAEFGKATFSDGSWFRDAAFSGDAGFEGAMFSGDAFFESTAIHGTAWFMRATFSGRAEFGRATFSDSALFEGAAFSGPARFECAAFRRYTDFNGAKFAGDVNLTGVVFCGPAIFSGEGALLHDSAITQQFFASEVQDSTGKGERALTGTLTKDAAVLPIAARSFKKITATNAIFLDLAMFDNRDILEPSSFQNVIFLRQAVFHRSQLIQGVSFHNARFDLAVRPELPCDGSKGRPDLLSRVQGAIKHLDPKARQKPVGVSDEYWTHQQQVHARVFSLIQDAIAKKLKTAPVAFGANLKSFNADKGRPAAIAAANSDDVHGSRAFEAADLKKANAEQAGADAVGRYYVALEDSFRTLKLAMENVRNRPEEGKFFRLELQARRMRRRPDVSWMERMASDIYRETADYGLDIGRPLIWLFSSVVFFAAVYTALAFFSSPEWAHPPLVIFLLSVFAVVGFWLLPLFRSARGKLARYWPKTTEAAKSRSNTASLGFRAFAIVGAVALLLTIAAQSQYLGPTNGKDGIEDGLNALSFSASRVFPFGPWAEVEAGTMMGQLLDKSAVEECTEHCHGFGPWSALGVSLLSSFQSLFSIGLTFLSGLALRRRFQIN